MNEFLLQFIYAGIIVAVVMGLSAVLGRGVSRLEERQRIPPFLVLPLRLFLKWGIFVLALLLVLHNFGVQIGGIWALLSTILAMIAIGFVAVWSMLSNFSATLLILILRPFEIGDDIEFVGEPTKGRVQRLGMAYTTLSEAEETVLQIPNNLFFQRILRRTRGKGTEDLRESLKRTDEPAPPFDPESSGADSQGSGPIP